jgi:SAM-dependent methyltransferase
MLPSLRRWLISKLGKNVTEGFASQEKTLHKPAEKYSIYRDVRILPFIDDKIIIESNALIRWHVFGVEELDEQAGGLRGLEYYELHKFRFLEMINAISYLSSKREIKELLEIGTIFSTKLISEFYPTINISTVDRYEEDEVGYEGIFRIRDITKAHYKIDFLVADIENIRIQPERPFDAVLLCEVIEHLLLHPQKIMKFIFNNLHAGGYLYLTTPNAFDKRKVQQFLERDFPFPVYPYNFKLSDSHMHHIREYGMSEILEACRDCGFQVEAFYFSACWDENKDASSFDNDELSNLVVLARKP